MKLSKDAKDAFKIISPFTIAGTIVYLIYHAISNRPKLIEGEVVDMIHTPERTEYEFSVNTDPQKTFNAGISPSHISAQWEIGVEGVDTRGQLRSAWWSIGPGLFERIKIGDRVTRNPYTEVVRIIKEGGN